MVGYVSLILCMYLLEILCPEARALSGEEWERTDGGKSFLIFFLIYCTYLREREQYHQTISIGIRILLLAYRQYTEYISFLRSFDWWWSRSGGLAVW